MREGMECVNDRADENSAEDEAPDGGGLVRSRPRIAPSVFFVSPARAHVHAHACTRRNEPVGRRECSSGPSLSAPSSQKMSSRSSDTRRTGEAAGEDDIGAGWSFSGTLCKRRNVAGFSSSRRTGDGWAERARFTPPELRVSPGESSPSPRSSLGSCAAGTTACPRTPARPGGLDCRDGTSGESRCGCWGSCAAASMRAVRRVGLTDE